MAKSETLDATDIRILRALQQNSKLTIKEIAAIACLSPSPTHDRIRRLEREGYIDRYVAVLSREKLATGLTVLCNIRLKQHNFDIIKDFMEAVQTLDEISECYNTSGEYDFMIKLQVRDMAHYQSFVLNELGLLGCIGSLHSIFVIGEVKRNLDLPLSLGEGTIWR